MLENPILTDHTPPKLNRLSTSLLRSEIAGSTPAGGIMIHITHGHYYIWANDKDEYLLKCFEEDLNDLPCHASGNRPIYEKWIVVKDWRAAEPIFYTDEKSLERVKKEYPQFKLRKVLRETRLELV